MEFRSVLEHHLKVRIRPATAETVSQPKFTFIPGEEQRDEFTLTKQALRTLRYYIDRQGCPCLKKQCSESEALWDLMRRVSRECFWVHNTQSEMPFTLYLSNLPFIVPDVPLCFEVMGLLLLKLTPGQSFLHINSGTGYACILASVLLGPKCVNHGVELRRGILNVARQNRERLLCYHPRFRDDNSVPWFHAQYPADLLHGDTKFDRILVSECFMDIQEAVDLKRLLKPDGRLVTGYLRDCDEQIGLAVVTRTEPAGEVVVIERIKGEDWKGPSLKLHPVTQEKDLAEIFIFLHSARTRTAELLARARNNAGEAQESALLPLRNLAMEACSKMADPLGHLLGDLRSRFLIRVSERYIQLPFLSSHLSEVIKELISFRTRCLAVHEDSFDDEDLQGVTDDFGRLVAAFDALVQQFVGQDHYSSWKDGRELLLSVPQGVMIWLLENVLHVVRYSKVSHKQCCFVAEDTVFDSCFPPDNVLTDQAGNISVPRPLLDAVMSFFRRVDFQVLDREPPWNYQLSYAKQMQRTLTRLAARLCADASGMWNIIREMKTLHEASNGGPTSSDPVLDSNLSKCQQLLTQLFDQVKNPESFTSFNIFQDIFSELTFYLKRMHYDTCLMIASGETNPEVLSLFYYFRFLDSSALRNLVGTGRVQQCLDPNQLQWVNSEGSLLDPTVFEAERDFLWGDVHLQDSVSVEAVCDFLVRRIMSDLKEALWLAEGVWTDKKLAMFEQNTKLNFVAVLYAFEPKFQAHGVLRSIA